MIELINHKKLGCDKSLCSRISIGTKNGTKRNVKILFKYYDYTH